MVQITQLSPHLPNKSKHSNLIINVITATYAIFKNYPITQNYPIFYPIHKPNRSNSSPFSHLDLNKPNISHFRLGLAKSQQIIISQKSENQQITIHFVSIQSLDLTNTFAQSLDLSYPANLPVQEVKHEKPRQGLDKFRQGLDKVSNKKTIVQLSQ